MSVTGFNRWRRAIAAARAQAETEVKTEVEKSADKPGEAELTNAQLKAMLDELGVKYDKRTNKETLKALLEAAQNKDTGDDNDKEDRDNDDEGAE